MLYDREPTTWLVEQLLAIPSTPLQTGLAGIVRACTSPLGRPRDGKIPALTCQRAAGQPLCRHMSARLSLLLAALALFDAPGAGSGVVFSCVGLAGERMAGLCACATGGAEGAGVFRPGGHFVELPAIHPVARAFLPACRHPRSQRECGHASPPNHRAGWPRAMQFHRR